MRRIASIIATAGGIGFLNKGGGTAAAVVFCLAWYFIPVGYVYQALLLVVLLAVGTWSATKMESVWEHDSNRIVIDEVAGMMITLAFLPDNWLYIVTGCVLFRFFDIVKPLGIKRAESLPRGIGVMADDVVAGIYAQLILRAMMMGKFL
ncbi:phosphatidylglycerophosphatase A [Niastella koreensis]|uniref:Phosphatidylglycerophosphatase A n=2 Tax=Niastella koreensis TaxID=354356 RepID=G8TLS0_NIAKG|nr:phosphatidylglycerophosphatase A [Niastella koreensis]AEV97662.1 phosphatidylglycerophosphatase A [Niastella koreensis GR20-10]OQP40515.1 phosphatidylglycerophosphatase A [Niastella koreensis]